MKPLKDYPENWKPPLDDPAGDVEMVECPECCGDECEECGWTGEVELTDEMRQQDSDEYLDTWGDDK